MFVMTMRWTSSECHVYSIFQQFSSWRYLHGLSDAIYWLDEWCYHKEGTVRGWSSYVEADKPTLGDFSQTSCISMKSVAFGCRFLNAFLFYSFNGANMNKFRQHHHSFVIGKAFCNVDMRQCYRLFLIIIFKHLRYAFSITQFACWTDGKSFRPQIFHAIIKLAKNLRTNKMHALMHISLTV